MSRLQSVFDDGKQLIPYVMAGFKDLPESQAVITALIDAGCRIVEIGVPYSDPLADGPTIQQAGEAALKSGVDTDDVFKLIAAVRKERDFSPVMMVYYNLVYRYGLQLFAAAAAAAGVEGVIIPDLSVEESADWLEKAAAAGLDTIFLAAPTSSKARLEKIGQASRGFVYCVSLTGVTGARRSLPSDLTSFVGRVRAVTKLPLAVGFGVSTPAQARAVAAAAEGVIIGSALIKKVAAASSTPAAVAAVRDFAAAVIDSLPAAERS